MLIFRDAGVLRGKCPVHLGGSIDGVGHRLEPHHQPIAKALHQDAAITRQYLGGDDTDEICPSANGGGFVLPHEPHRFHKVDQQHDGLLPHEPAPRSRTSDSSILAACFCPLSTASSFMLILTSRSQSPHTIDIEPRAKGLSEKDSSK